MREWLSNLLVTATQPLRTIMRFPEDVEVIRTRLGVTEPGLKCGHKRIACQWPSPTGIHDVKFIIAENLSYLRKTFRGYTNFNVVVRPRLSPYKEIERPAGDDIPSCASARQPRRNVFRSPRLPDNIVSEYFAFDGRLRIHRAILSAERHEPPTPGADLLRWPPTSDERSHWETDSDEGFIGCSVCNVRTTGGNQLLKTENEKRSLRKVNALATALIASIVGGGLASAASSTSGLATSVLYVGHGVEVIATIAPTGCSTVYLTTDFTHWRNVTPPLKTSSGTCNYAWGSAAFTSPKVGWLLGRVEDNATTVLEHTVDGGRTWVAQPGESTGGNGGSDVIGFANDAVGWRQMFPTGNQIAFQRTVDGGSTWMNVPGSSKFDCRFLPDVFASASIGFSASPLSGAFMGAEAANLPYVWRTLDGGSTWSKMNFPRPPSIAPGTPSLYGQPAFTGSDGTLPVVYPVGGKQDVFFYSTTDAGLTWSLVKGLASPLSVKGAITINRTAVSQGCAPSTAVAAGALVSVDIVSPTTWWVLRPGPKGNTERFIVADNGKSVSNYVTVELPKTTPGALLQAVNSFHALLTLRNDSGEWKLFSTADGGATWVALTPPRDATNFTTPASKPPIG